MTLPAAAPRSYRAEGMLLLLTLVWGSTFPAVKASLEYASPILFVSMRFAAAALLLAMAFPRLARAVPGATWRDGGLLGLLMTAAFVAQTLGLEGTSASRSGFLTALYVPFTPLLQVFFGRGAPRGGIVAAAAIVLGGLYLLSTPDGRPLTGLLDTFSQGLNVGDWWTVVCAMLFALYIIGLDVWAPRHDALQLTFVQLLVCGVIAGAAAPLLEYVRLTPGWPLGASIAYLALFASLVAIFIQTRYQRETTPARAALIFAMESVFAALLAAAFLGDSLGRNELLGGGLIVAGLVVSELARGQADAPPVGST